MAVCNADGRVDRCRHFLFIVVVRPHGFPCAVPLVCCPISARSFNMQCIYSVEWLGLCGIRQAERGRADRTFFIPDIDGRCRSVLAVVVSECVGRDIGNRCRSTSIPFIDWRWWRDGGESEIKSAACRLQRRLRVQERSRSQIKVMVLESSSC